MAIHIIIDGYNLIRQSMVLSPLDRQDMQLGRETLIDMLAEYKKLKHHEITVVFDGSDAPVFSGRGDFVKGIAIKFSANGESADTLIKKMAAKEKEKALVVSSDRDISHYCSGVGTITMDAPDFEDKIEMASYLSTRRKDREDNSGWIPTTKKKGPSRRSPRKKRRGMWKINKL